MSDGAGAAAMLDAALHGDRAAWEQIVNDHSRLLWWVVRRLRLDDETAADVVQTVWLQLVQHGHSIRNPERLANWLAVTTRREGLRRIGKLQREAPSADTEDQQDLAAAPLDERLLDEEAIGAAIVAFAEISAACRELLSLLIHEPPLSYAEIAAKLGKSPGYIGPTRARCLAHLRQRMALEDD